MLAGFGVCLFYLIGTHYFPEWFISMFGSDTAKEAMATGMQAIADKSAAGGTVEELAVMQTAYFKAMQAQANWWGIRNISCGLFGIPVAFVVTWLVSLITPAPSREMQDFIDSVRVPRGAVRHAAGQAGIE
jgi:cation/acetate symporter